MRAMQKDAIAMTKNEEIWKFFKQRLAINKRKTMLSQKRERNRVARIQGARQKQTIKILPAEFRQFTFNVKPLILR
ncbi:MAG TPA: hypothetical protein VLB46_11850 [Pyrinomonadaceae bacterium]|nr:hypothetical protein [Pyrinomonadaceae bacterium]